MDVTIIDKDTEAYIDSGAVVRASENVKVRAVSSETVLGVSATVAFAAEGASIAGSSNVHVYDIDVFAYIADMATVYAGGNIAVSVDSKTGVDLIAGDIAITGEGAGVGASAVVVTINKNVAAYIGQSAVVDAEGNANAITVADGGFEVVYNPEDDDETDITAPDIENNEANDESVIRSRQSTPTSTTIKGIAVTAINRDDIEMIAVGGAAGIVGAGIELSAAVAVLDVSTLAYINNGAAINTNVTNPSSDQSLLVAAGSDHYQMGVAGSLAVGAGGIGPGAHVTVLDYETQAYIDDDAIVYAAGDILVRAYAQRGHPVHLHQRGRRRRNAFRRGIRGGDHQPDARIHRAGRICGCRWQCCRRGQRHHRHGHHRRFGQRHGRWTGALPSASP